MFHRSHSPARRCRLNGGGERREPSSQDSCDLAQECVWRTSDQLESERLDLGEGSTLYMRHVYAKIGVHRRTEAVGAPELDGLPAPS